MSWAPAQAKKSRKSCELCTNPAAACAHHLLRLLSLDMPTTLWNPWGNETAELGIGNEHRSSAAHNSVGGNPDVFLGTLFGWIWSEFDRATYSPFLADFLARSNSLYEATKPPEAKVVPETLWPNTLDQNPTAHWPQ